MSIAKMIEIGQWIGSQNKGQVVYSRLCTEAGVSPHRRPFRETARALEGLGVTRALRCRVRGCLAWEVL